MVPRAGLEPAWPLALPRDFKSLVSTSFTTRARGHFIVARRARGGIDCVNGRFACTDSRRAVSALYEKASEEVRGEPCARECSRADSWSGYCLLMIDRNVRTGAASH
jgi:hypothetical protein